MATRRLQKSNATVYLLWHTDRYGDDKLIGVYEKRVGASSAMHRTGKKPGFSAKGGSFEIVAYELNKDHWIEGFNRRQGHSLPAWFRPRA